ncbi:hypothetical protein [Stenotrophomonas sp. AB1(2024)]|uniref:hypothetical protein n=1 Tax=Stenotrophomonas sp. AB1(2024) TaxID=3132215 RepID=UPI0030AAA718
MSRGIKMRRALGTFGTPHRVEDLQKRHDAQQTLPTLLCDSPGCGVSVRFVTEHTRSRADRTTPIHVPAYIALKKGVEHIRGCRYDAPGRLQTILAAGSDPDFLQALDDGKHELRLLLLQQGLKRGSNQAPASPAPTASASATRRPTTYQGTGQRLDSYLRTVADLLTLRAMCDDDAVLAAQLTLRLGKKKIEWSNFFYEPDRYDEAWERLGAASTDLPMALVGTVRSHRSPPPGASYSATYLNCTSKYQRTGVTDQMDFYEVSVGHDDAAWLQSFPVGADIVMFGLWRQGKTTSSIKVDSKDATRKITYVTHKLALWPGFKRQLALVD